MAVIRWLVGGLIGAVTGIVIWVLIGYFTRYKSWVDRLGFGILDRGWRSLCRVPPRRGSQFWQRNPRGHNGDRRILPPSFSCCLILFGERATRTCEAANQIRFDDEAMIAKIADEIAEEAMSRGEKIAWPPGMSREKASKQNDFPATIWKKAKPAGTNSD